VQFGPGLFSRLTDSTGVATASSSPPGPLPLMLGLVSTLVCAVFVAVGMLRLRRNTTAAYRWFYRALLVNLLFTRVFEFDVEQFLATFSVVVDVVMLAVVTAALTLRGPPVVAVVADSRLVPDVGGAAEFHAVPVADGPRTPPRQ
jgi:hypothetical protein